MPLNDLLDNYLKEQKEAFLVLPLDSRTAYLNDLCYRLFFTSSKDKAWFPLQCSVSRKVVSGISLLSVSLDGAARQSRTLSERVVEAIEGEQGRLSREMHDGMLQCVVGARMLLDRVMADVPRESLQFESLLDVEECLAQANSEGRRLLENLRPATIDELGLANALTLFLERMQRESGTEFEFDNQCQPGTRFPPEVRSNLYRILQEGVHNAVKHSGSSRIRVSLGMVDEEAWARVEDWGVGFEVEQTQEQSTSGHMGLSSLRERVSLLGGRCQIASRPNQGTSIEVTVPLETALETGFTNLRTRAQSILQRRPSDHAEEDLVAELGTDEVAALLHEFEVHRTELEIQNNELRLAQRELISSRDRFRALYEHTSLGYLELDRTGRILSANHTLSSLLGRPQAEILGQTIDSLLAPGSGAKCRSPGCREVKMLRKAEPGWFWARVKTRNFAEKQLHVSVEDLSSERREAAEAARVNLHLEITKRKELLVRPLSELFADLLERVSDPGQISLDQKLKASIEGVLQNQFRSSAGADTEQNLLFEMDSSLSDILSALSLAKELERLTFLPNAGGAVLAGDPVLFGVLVERLLELASALPSPDGSITLSTGFLDLDGQRNCFLEAAKTRVGEISESETRSGPMEICGLQQLAENFAGKVSSFHESNRGTTIRVLLPRDIVEED